MSDKQKSILLGVMLVIMIALAIVGRLLKNNDESSDNQMPSNVIIDGGKENKLYDYNTFFSLKNIVDKLDDNISYHNTEVIIDVLSKEYLNINHYNSNNIVDVFLDGYESIKRYLSNVYYSCTKTNCYYFTQLDGFLSTFEGNGKKLDTSFVIIIHDLRTNAYRIDPIEVTNNNIEEFIKNYQFKDISIEKNDNNDFNSITIDDKEIIIYYLNYTRYLIEYDNNHAYNYVINYNSYNQSKYAEKLSNVLYSYKKEQIENGIKYSGMLYDGTLFTIQDYSPMNFKISFD